MGRVGIYLTHPQVRIDPAVPVPDWGLTEEGLTRCVAAAGRMPDHQLHVVSSGERKALETAWPFGARAGVPVEVRPDMHENDRSATGYLPPDAFEAARIAFFTRPDVSFKGWETAVDAQSRILNEVRAVVSARPEDTILFCGHGGVGALLLAGLQGAPIGLEWDRGGGGHWFSFDLGTREIISDWHVIETLFA